MTNKLLGSLIFALLLFTLVPDCSAQRPRLFVLTDIGGDPDDQQSMRRLMLYSHAFRFVGLVASASGTPGELDSRRVQPQLIEEIVRDYAAVRENLLLHQAGFPHPDSLLAVIRPGSAQRGVQYLGPGRTSAGAAHLIDAVDAATPADPVYLTIWGGAHDLAQALYDVRVTRSPDALADFLSRLRVYAIGDQDGYNTVVDGVRQDVAGTGAWIKAQFPDLRYVETNPPDIDRFAALFRGMYQNDSKGGDYPEAPLVDDAVASLNQEAWVHANIRNGHGPLGEGYPITGQNPGSARNTRGVKEGDTPSWFFALSLGLSDPENPAWGGWGGRFQRQAGNHYVDAADRHPADPENIGLGYKWTVARWRAAYQNDFAARMDWCVLPFDETNHPPAIILDGDAGAAVLTKYATAGESLVLDAAGTTDPDGDALIYHWWLYEEPSGFSNLSIDGSDTPRATLAIPGDAVGHDLHIILAVTDAGIPALTRYRRIVISVRD